jgi:DNA-binding NarL/FixJ family response regulator
VIHFPATFLTVPKRLSLLVAIGYAVLAVKAGGARGLDYAERVFRAGAHGYVNKRETAQKVVEAIRRVLEGKFYVSEKTAEILAGKTVRGQAVNRSAIELLSDRELEVFDKLGQGIGTKQIAADFHVSIKTIQEYCARIKVKLNLNNATELLREAVRWHDAKNFG